jgi:hypothetical protein
MPRLAARTSWGHACTSAWCAALVLLVASAAAAQDERRVVSPDGRTEFRVFVAQPGSNVLPQLAYQVRRGGTLVVNTSFLGLDIYNQEPILGENDGLMSSRAGEEPGRYRWLIAEYMQNGSLGRRINLEVRVWDDEVAFRYVVPQSSPLDEILIADEVTEFDVAGRSAFSSDSLPAAAPAQGGGWVRISELPVPGFPAMSLARTSDGIVRAHLPPRAAIPRVAFEGHTPLVCPWRVLTFAQTRELALQAGVGISAGLKPSADR